jgi:hypothetical protein
VTRLDPSARRRRQHSVRDFVLTVLVAAATLISLSSLAVAIDPAAGPSVSTR